MNVYRTIKPHHLPEPFLIDSQHLLKELDRIRSLILMVPHRTENAGPINTVIDSVWRLQEQIRYLINLRADGQRDFAKKHNDTLDGNSNENGNHDATSPSEARMAKEKKVIIPQAGKAVASRG